MNTETLPLAEAVASLDLILTEALDPEAALASLRALRARYPELRIELVWEDDFAGRPQYELLMGARGDTTACLSLVPAETSPFAMRGAQRWTEAQLFAVDGRRVFVHEALVLLDAIWDDARVLDRLVEHYVVGRALENHPCTVDDAALQVAVDRFRADRGLTDPAQTQKWLADHGLSLVDLERGMTRQLSERQLRRTLVGAEVEASFAADPSAWDEVAVVAFPTEDLATAQGCVAALADGAAWMDVAERTLAGRATAPRGARSVVFETLRRRDIAVLEGDAVKEGAVVIAELSGRGPYVVAVRSIAAAVLDDATREVIEQERWGAWLARARAEAHVEWNWGPRGDEG